MIYKDYNRLKIAQQNIVNQNNLSIHPTRYLSQDISKIPYNLHSPNFKYDSFVVDWQLSMEEKSAMDTCSY